MNNKTDLMKLQAMTVRYKENIITELIDKLINGKEIKSNKNIIQFSHDRIVRELKDRR